MKRVAVLRPEEKMADSISVVWSKGLEPVCASPLRVEIVDSECFDHFVSIASSGGIDSVILTSAIGARAMTALAEKRMRRDEFLSLVRSIRVLTIGPQTARALEDMRIRVDLVPETYSSEGILDFLPREEVEGRRIVLVRSDRGERRLLDVLKDRGAVVSELVVYRLVPVTDSPGMRGLVRAFLDGGIDAFAFTSPLSATTFLRAAAESAPMEDVLAALSGSVVGAIGEPTRRALEESGVRVDVVPEAATFERLIDAIKERLDRGDVTSLPLAPERS